MRYALTMTLVLAACGGGGDAPEQPAPPVKRNIALVDKINPKDVDVLKVALVPGDTLVLNSKGGHMLSSFTIAHDVKRKGVHVIVPAGGMCASACAFILLAAPSADIRGLVVIHRPTNGSQLSREVVKGFVREVAPDRYPDYFTALAWGTPNYKIRYLTRPEQEMFFNIVRN